MTDALLLTTAIVSATLGLRAIFKQKKNLSEVLGALCAAFSLIFLAVICTRSALL